jgi:hypothetical protein
MPQYNQRRAGQLKGPEDRLNELKTLRAEVVKKKPDLKAGYDPQMQLKSIDSEIARLSEWLSSNKQ